MNTPLHQETHLQVLRLLESNPQISQRDLAVALGGSLGKTTFCLRALLDKGLVKVQNFQNNKQKLAYAHLLTPEGIAEKSVLTKRFLVRKLEEFELLKAQIEMLRRETEHPQQLGRP
jgi:EPS-associated MarR family transcriptional regulator